MSDLNQALSVEQAGSLIAELLNEPENQVKNSRNLKALAGWDSMGFLMIMAELDERFNVIITESELKAINSFEDLITLLRDKHIVEY